MQECSYEYIFSLGELARDLDSMEFHKKGLCIIKNACCNKYVVKRMPCGGATAIRCYLPNSLRCTRKLYLVLETRSSVKPEPSAWKALMRNLKRCLLCMKRIVMCRRLSKLKFVLQNQQIRMSCKKFPAVFLKATVLLHRAVWRPAS